MIQQYVSLKQYNTFGIDVFAKSFARISNIEDLQLLLKKVEKPLFVLGGGSNILLTQNIDRMVVKNEIKGYELVEETPTEVVVGMGGGNNWHETVLWAIQNDLGGIENLSLIPGTVGAAPIQNIGAYGVELKDVFERVEAIDLSTGQRHVFDKTACEFGYRNSIFKTQYKDQFCITKVYLRLQKKGHHHLQTEYGTIQQELETQQIIMPTIQDISKAVIAIRSRKLPNPVEIGNSGSFFKNPIISEAHFRDLQKQFPSMVSYPAGHQRFKIPAGWLIEQCGWKGKVIGNVACYHKQALVLVNLGGASGSEILAHAQRVMDSVYSTFGIQLESEVNIL